MHRNVTAPRSWNDVSCKLRSKHLPHNRIALQRIILMDSNNFFALIHPSLPELRKQRRKQRPRPVRQSQWCTSTIIGGDTTDAKVQSHEAIDRACKPRGYVPVVLAVLVSHDLLKARSAHRDGEAQRGRSVRTNG